MRFGEILLAYFLIGATMWAGGVIVWDDVGVGDAIFDEQEQGGLESDEDIEEDLEGMGGPISSALNTVAGGALLAVWGIISDFISFVFWPITVLIAVDAPIEIVVVLGGGLVIVFVAAVIRIIRGSA